MSTLNLRESLLKIDRETGFKHTLTDLYEACRLNEDNKRKLAQYIEDRDIPGMSKMLSNCAGVMAENVSDDISDEELNEVVGNPAELSDCPSCGDVSFDTKKGRCTKCFYRESLNEWFDDEDEEESSEYEFVSRKSVEDSDGFMTDYTWYKAPDGRNVFVFGDRDYYKPEDGNFDWEEEDDEAAQEWFDSYSGFDDSFLDESMLMEGPFAVVGDALGKGVKDLWKGAKNFGKGLVDTGKDMAKTAKAVGKSVGDEFKQSKNAAKMRDVWRAAKESDNVDQFKQNYNKRQTDRKLSDRKRHTYYKGRAGKSYGDMQDWKFVVGGKKMSYDEFMKLPEKNREYMIKNKTVKCYDLSGKEVTVQDQAKRLSDALIREGRQLHEGPGAGYTIESFGYNMSGSLNGFTMKTNVNKWGRTEYIFDCDVSLTGEVESFYAEAAYSHTGVQHDLPITCDHVVVEVNEEDLISLGLFTEDAYETDSLTEENVDKGSLFEIITDELARARCSFTYGGGWSHASYDGQVTEDYLSDIYMADIEADIFLADEEDIRKVDRMTQGYGYETIYMVGDPGDYVEGFEDEDEAIAYAKENGYTEVRISYESEDWNGDIDSEPGQVVWTADEDVEESLQERNLTRSERHNRNLERTFDFKKQTDNKMMQFLRDNSDLSEEEIKKAYDDDKLGLVIKELGLHDAFWSKNESLKEDWTHFEFKSGSNPYIAKTEKEKNRILRKYGDKAKEVKPGFYEIDDTGDNPPDLFKFDSLTESAGGRFNLEIWVPGSGGDDRERPLISSNNMQEIIDTAYATELDSDEAFYLSDMKGIYPYDLDQCYDAEELEDAIYNEWHYTPAGDMRKTLGKMLLPQNEGVESSKEWEHKGKDGKIGRIRQSDGKGDRKSLTRDQAEEIAKFRGHGDDELYPVSESKSINESLLGKKVVGHNIFEDPTGYKKVGTVVFEDPDDRWPGGGHTIEVRYGSRHFYTSKISSDWVYVLDDEPPTESKSIDEDIYGADSWEAHQDKMARKTSGYDKCYKEVCKALESNDYNALSDIRDHFGYDLYKMCLGDARKKFGESFKMPVNEAFKPADSGVQSVKVYNQYNYTIQELRIDNDNHTFERGNFTMGKPDKKFKNRQQYEDVVDQLKELGYTEIGSDYQSLRNKSRKGEPTNESWQLIKTDKWYDPEGLGIAPDAEVICSGTEGDCRKKFDEIVAEVGREVAKDNEFRKSAGKAVYIKPSIKIDRLDDSSLVVYYPGAKAKDVYTLKFICNDIVSEDLNILRPLKEGNFDGYEIKNVNGHYEAYKNGKFVCSGDTESEVKNELKKQQNEAFEHPQNKGPFWYLCKHGIGPGAIPKGVTVVDTVDDEENPYRCYVALDKVLTTDELKQFEMKEQKPPKMMSEAKHKRSDNYKGIKDRLGLGKKLTEADDGEFIRFEVVPDNRKWQYSVGGKDVPYTSYEDAISHINDDYNICDYRKELQQYLKSNGFNYFVDETFDGRLCIEIHRGDWKHEHRRADYLVRHFFMDKGLGISVDEQVTDEDGSDCYSAEHYYSINDLYFSGRVVD